MAFSELFFVVFIALTLPLASFLWDSYCSDERLHHDFPIFQSVDSFTQLRPTVTAAETFLLDG